MDGDEYKLEIGECTAACRYKDKVQELNIAKANLLKELKTAQKTLYDLQHKLAGEVTLEQRTSILEKLKKDTDILRIEGEKEELHEEITKVNIEIANLTRLLEKKEEEIHLLLSENDEIKLNNHIRALKNLKREEEKKYKMLVGDRIRAEKEQIQLRSDNRQLAETRDKLIQQCNGIKQEIVIETAKRREVKKHKWGRAEQVAPPTVTVQPHIKQYVQMCLSKGFAPDAIKAKMAQGGLP
ncbi:MAG: hypothetical protein EHM12_10875, partial [Dehalococcoidia bacterium]